MATTAAKNLALQHWKVARQVLPLVHAGHVLEEGKGIGILTFNAAEKDLPSIYNQIKDYHHGITAVQEIRPTTIYPSQYVATFQKAGLATFVKNGTIEESIKFPLRRSTVAASGAVNRVKEAAAAHFNARGALISKVIFEKRLGAPQKVTVVNLHLPVHGDPAKAMRAILDKTSQVHTKFWGEEAPHTKIIVLGDFNKHHTLNEGQSDISQLFTNQHGYHVETVIHPNAPTKHPQIDGRVNPVTGKKTRPEEVVDAAVVLTQQPVHSTKIVEVQPKIALKNNSGTLLWAAPEELSWSGNNVQYLGQTVEVVSDHASVSGLVHLTPSPGHMSNR